MTREFGEWDHYNADEIMCPYCRYQFTESWEFFQGSHSSLSTVQCHDCEKYFEVEQEFTVHYTSYKKE